VLKAHQIEIIHFFRNTEHSAFLHCVTFAVGNGNGHVRNAVGAGNDALEDIVDGV
jgi:hypothetical protein